MKKIITAAALALLCAACSSTTNNAESVQVADARQIHVGSRSDTHAETNQVNKIPLLGDMPVLGHLFKNQTKEMAKREMLVFITPRMLTENGIKR